MTTTTTTPPVLATSTSEIALAEARFIDLITFRRTGEPVGTPVLFVLDADRLLVRTAAASGKLKRLRHTARVELAPSDQRDDPSSRSRAVARLMESGAEEHVLTGVLYADPEASDFLTRLGTVDAPLATLPEEAVRPGRSVLDEVNESLR